MSKRILRSGIAVLMFSCFFMLNYQGQYAINHDGSSAHASALLELKATDGGFIMPRLTEAQRSALATTSDGLMVYQTDNERGFYMMHNGSWVNISALETYRGNINMGTVPTVINGTITAPMLSTLAEGQLRVDFTPAMTSDYTVMLTTEFLPNPSAPAPDIDYCEAKFSALCVDRYETQEVGVFIPAGTAASELNNLFSSGFAAPTSLSNMIWHYAALAGAGCNSTADNYHYHPNDGSVLEGPTGTATGTPTDIYDDPYDLSSFGLFPVTSTIDAIPAGTDCDIVISGNEQGNPARLMNMSVFIDWNSDGDYFDSVDGISELVVSTPFQQWPPAGASSALPGYADGVNVFTISVPPNAVNGDLAMRTMATRFGNNQGPCMFDSNGSSRDYDFRVSGGTTPVRPGRARTCNIHNQDLSGFEVRCFDDNGTPVDNKIYLTINPR